MPEIPVNLLSMVLARLLGMKRTIVYVSSRLENNIIVIYLPLTISGPDTLSESY